MKKKESTIKVLGSAGLFLALLFTSACGTLFGSGSAGEAASVASDLVAGVDTVDFDVSASSTVYHAVTFTNFTATSLTVTKLAFYNNVCNDFSLYDITDTSTGNILVTTGASPTFNLATNSQANINVRYSQTASCPYNAGSGYQTTLYIYYTQNGADQIASVTLEPTGSTGAGGVFACDVITDNSALYTESGITAPEDGTYYLRIDRMRGYMYGTSITVVESAQRIMGTDVNGLTEEDFTKPFIQTDISGTKVTLHQIIDTTDFCLPSPKDNKVFGGAWTLLTSDADYTGSILSTGSVLVSSVGDSNIVSVTILSEHIPNGLLFPIADSNGTFQISLNSDLSTGKVPSGTADSTVITAGLAEAYSQTDDNGDPLLPIKKGSGGSYYLQGTALSNGTITFVGIGQFVNTNNTFIGDDVDLAKTSLLENEAYIFILLDATVMKAVAGGT